MVKRFKSTFPNRNKDRTSDMKKYIPDVPASKILLEVGSSNDEISDRWRRATRRTFNKECSQSVA